MDIGEQICGVALIVLYIFELALGTLVHLRRPKDGKGHPPRNVAHVVLGLAVFGLSIYTVSAPLFSVPLPQPSAGHLANSALWCPRAPTDHKWRRPGRGRERREPARRRRDMHRLGSGECHSHLVLPCAI